MAKVLIVEDEAKVVHLLREVLTMAGYDICVANHGQAGIEQVALEQPNLVILDILLPGDLDGYQVAQKIREFSDLPIVMLTGRVRETDLLRGFDVGADDYITKPFSAKELLARINAVLKRSESGARSQKIENEIVCGGIIIDVIRRRVLVNGHEIHLTHTEYDLLHEMAKHPNQVMLHEQLLSAVWGVEYQNDIDYLKAYIHSLRQKVEEDPANPKVILRHPGVGYSLACGVSNRHYRH